MLDWYEILEGFNYKYKTNYESERDLLKILYSRRKSTVIIAKKLGISYHSVIKKMNEFDLKRRHPLSDEEILKVCDESKNLRIAAEKLGYNHSYLRRKYRKLLKEEQNGI